MKDFRKLNVWKKAHELVLKTYQETAHFPKAELYGITSQLRRAATSIPTNIVEGSSRGSDKDFGRFIQIAIGSSSEVEYLLILSSDLEILNENISKHLQEEVVEIRKMLISLNKKLK